VRLVFALILTATAGPAQTFGGFVEAQVRVLSDEEVSAPGEAKKQLPLTLVELRGTSWSENRILRHVRRTAETLGACGVALGPVTLASAKTSDGRHDLDMTVMHPQAGTPVDVFRIAGLLPRETRWPVAFFVGRLIGDATPARSYGRVELEPGREKDFPYANTAWLSYKAHSIERDDHDYSSLAHELVHLLCECGHVRDDERHILNTHRNMLSSRILPEHCERILASPLLTPAGHVDITTNP
jgi:hypothetical protein